MYLASRHIGQISLSNRRRCPMNLQNRSPRSQMPLPLQLSMQLQSAMSPLPVWCSCCCNPHTRILVDETGSCNHMFLLGRHHSLRSPQKVLCSSLCHCKFAGSFLLTRKESNKRFHSAGNSLWDSNLFFLQEG